MIGQHLTRHGLGRVRSWSIAAISFAFNLNFGALIGGLSFAFLGADTLSNLLWGPMGDRLGFRIVYILSLALVIVIVAEMFIGSTDGLGQRVMNAQMVFDMPEMYAAIFAAGALGYVMNLVFIVAERRFVHWGGK